MKSVTRLATGQIVDVTDLQSSQVRVWDFAWGQHHINRYLGHTPVPWSVLSHVGLCYHLAMTEHKGNVNPFERIGILIHDVTEAYISDMPRPLKERPEAAWFKEQEDAVMVVILARLGLTMDQIDWKFVKRYDDQALHVEMHTLMPDLRGQSHLPLPIYDSGYPKLTVCQPSDYVALLRDLFINLSDSNGGRPADINSLFFLPDHLEPYAKAQPQEHQRQSSSAGAGTPSSSDADVLNMRIV